MTQPTSGKIDSIQHLRFAAAAMVLFGHAMMEAHKLGIVATAVYRTVDLFPWGSGVDMFFILSGFIICHVTKDTGRSLSEVKTFALRRIIRIYPIYWIYTALMMVAIFWFSGSVTNNVITSGYLLSSILLFPWPRPSDQLIRPILGQGWTLSYEMLFYVIFGSSLFLAKSSRYFVVCASIVFLFIIGNLFIGSNWIFDFISYSIILEFIIGISVYIFVSRVWEIKFASSAALIVAGFVGLFLGEFLSVPDSWRVASRGLPSAFIVLGWIFSERSGVFPKGFSVLKRLGDASYSLYLSHPFVIVPTAILWKKFNIGQPVAFIFLVVFSSIVFSIISFNFFEKRLNEAISRSFGN